MIQENCAGKDGQEYVLQFNVEITSNPELTIPPYERPFLFYNGLVSSSLYLVFDVVNESGCWFWRHVTSSQSTWIHTS